MAEGEIFEFLESDALDHSAPLTILEIGCADGQDSAKLVRLFPRAKIFCFEPDPRNIYLLQKIGAPKFVTLVEAAVSDTDGKATFNLSDGHHPADKSGKVAWTYSSSLKAPTGHLKDFPWVKFDRTAQVRTVRLDTFAREHNLDTVDFIWADVQGAEDLLIAGGQQTLARTRYFFTEVYDGAWYQGQIGFDELRSRLPGGAEQWELVKRMEFDALFRNRAI